MAGQHANGEGILPAWSEHLDAPPRKEALEDAWRIALAVDQGVEASTWNVSAAGHAYAAARAERLPSLSAGANYLVLSDRPAFSMNTPPLPPVELPFLSQDSFGFHAVVTQPLYTFGRISSGIGAAGAEISASQADMERKQLDVKMNVAEIYISVLRTARLVEVANSKVGSLSAHAADVENRFKQAMVSRNDLLAVQVALADAQQQAVQARNTLEMVRAAYNRALGRNLTDPVDIMEVRGEGEPESVDALTQMALQRRPEIAGLSAQAQALQAQAAETRARRAPQIGIQAGYLYQGNRFVDPNGLAGMALTAQWTAFDSGRAAHRATALCQRAEALIRMRKEAESLIALEVRQKWLELQTASQRLEFARTATAQADENLRVARDRYQQAVGTNTEVLDAETLRAQAYTNRYGSFYETVLAGLRLRRAVGNL
jgi:outer membrane protein TolC